MSVDPICTGCPYAPTYEEYCNGWSDCPDAYTEIAVHCGRNQKHKRECTNCKWYGTFTCECPFPCTSDTKEFWEQAEEDNK